MKAASVPNSSLDVLREAIEEAAKLLPAQGPITVFIHHNTLHAFENSPFGQAVVEGAETCGCEPYLPESEYREALLTGRIRADDLYDILEDDLGFRAFDGIARLVNRLELRLAMLQYPLRTGPTEELLWFIAMTGALRHFRRGAPAAVKQKLIAETRRWVMRDLRGRTGGNGTNGAATQPQWTDEIFELFPVSKIERWSADTWESFTLEVLWRVCREGVRGVAPFTPPASLPLRHRELLLPVTGHDIDMAVNAILIRFCAAFVDQGIAHWQLPNRARGFLDCFATLYRQPWASPEPWQRPLGDALAHVQNTGMGALESIRQSLAELGVAEAEWRDFLEQTVLALRGWGGILRQIETRGDRVAQPIPAGSLTDFLAVRLLLERCALAHAAQEHLDYTGPLATLRDELRRRQPPPVPPSAEQRAFIVFKLAQVFGWSPDQLHGRSAEQWSQLVAEIETFSGIERRRVFHAAYEKRFREQTLDALTLHARQPGPAAPRFQVITCLDEREESFRRHLEEAVPDCETFGAAGFFGVAMYYRGMSDAHFVPLCPIVIRPGHFVEEQAEEPPEETHQRRQARKAIAAVSHRLHVGTRGMLAGAILTAGMGVLATFPLVMRTLFPRLAARISARLFRLVHGAPGTRLRLERGQAEPGSGPGQLGYTVAEMIDIAGRQLRDIGLTGNFARLVLIIGHRSNSMNNPHASAYDCGACGGSAGGANARALAQMLNDARVRAGLAGRGLVIPEQTVFLGGQHNTCNESVEFFDEDRLPDFMRAEFQNALESVKHALDANAHERARRFESAPLALTFPAARQHVDNRAEDLAEVRPELGHATNAVCVIGRRERTRGLFLDRRAFLVSYDPIQDDAEQAILARILAAAVPVCAGINLEYYFCRVDPSGWGCGTKLPHNITALVGVMDGAASDLRTGLPRQMVEIHEPMRLLIVVETTSNAMSQLCQRHEALGRLVRNEWVQLAVLDPGSSRIELFERGAFFPYAPHAHRLPTATTSVEWYRGWRDHLEFADIG